MSNKEVVLSGIRATGNLHLGNYYGALSKFVKMQNDYDCLFFIADLHALTTNPDPDALHENVKNILAEYLAAGIDPEKATIFVQSDVPEISEMYLLLNMHVGIGELLRTASFKDKARKQLGSEPPALTTISRSRSSARTPTSASTPACSPTPPSWPSTF